jgi:hypothetical protein
MPHFGIATSKIHSSNFNDNNDTAAMPKEVTQRSGKPQ